MLMYFKPIEHEKIIDPNDNKMWRINYSFDLYSSNGVMTMHSVKFTSKTSRDRTMKRLGEKFGVEIRK